ncbi:MAG: methyl-accepting chemotaxis protein [Treponema sp.]|jgi:hypothetical protein|nr:methyl-accepting chemotaxis protein [Treponema sp.]
MSDQNIEAAGKPAFENVWAMMQETGRQIREISLRMKETDRQIKETDRHMKETDRQMGETGRQIREISLQMKETDRHMKETDRHMGETGRQIREISLQMKETDRHMKETDRQMKETDRQMKETDRAIKEAQRIAGNLGNKLGIVVEHLVLANIREKFNALGYNFTKMGPSVLIEDTDMKLIAEVDAMLENGEYALAIEVKTQLRTEHVNEHIKRLEKLRRYADDRQDARKFIGAVAGAVVTDNVKTYAEKKGFYVIQQSGDTVVIKNPGGFKPKEW